MPKGRNKLAGETVAVEFVPGEPGRCEFACQLSMFRGKLIVE